MVAVGDLDGFLALTPAQLAALFGSGMLVPVCVNLMSFWSMKRMPLNVHAPLFRTYVVNVFILSLLFLKSEKWSAGTAAAVFVTFIGVVAFSAARKKTGEGRVALTPVVVCLVAALCLSVGKVLWKVMEGFATPSMIAFASTLTCATLFNIAYAIARPPSGKAPVLARAVISGVLVFAGGNFLTMTAMKYAPLAVVSTIHSTSILIIAALAYVFLKERWTRSQTLAAVTICAGVALLVVFK